MTAWILIIYYTVHSGVTLTFRRSRWVKNVNKNKNTNTQHLFSTDLYTLFTLKIFGDFWFLRWKKQCTNIKNGQIKDNKRSWKERMANGVETIVKNRMSKKSYGLCQKANPTLFRESMPVSNDDCRWIRHGYFCHICTVFVCKKTFEKTNFAIEMSCTLYFMSSNKRGIMGPLCPANGGCKYHFMCPARK